MSLQIAEAGHIRNADCHAASGRAREKIESVLRDAHFAQRVADNVERQLTALDATKVSAGDILFGRVEGMMGVDFAALDKAKKLIDALIDAHGECCTVEMGAQDHSLFGIREAVEGMLDRTQPLRKYAKR